MHSSALCISSATPLLNPIPVSPIHPPHTGISTPRLTWVVQTPLPAHNPSYHHNPSTEVRPRSLAGALAQFPNQCR